MRARKGIFGAAAVLAVLGAGGTAYAATSSSGSNTSATEPAKAAKAGRSLLQRADHATVEVKAKGQWVTYTLDRGKVTAVSPTSITLARPDGQSVTEAISSGTRFLGVSSEAAVRVGAPAQVISDGGTAIRIRQKAAS